MNLVSPRRHGPVTAVDPMVAWPACRSTVMWLPDQGPACSSCWAVATAGSIAARRCIASGMGRNETPSASCLLACLPSCGDCRGGSATCVFQRWARERLPSVYLHEAAEGGCDRTACRDDESGRERRGFVTAVYGPDDVEAAMLDIAEHGPCVATMRLGAAGILHYVRLLGWDDRGDWLVADSRRGGHVYGLPRGKNAAKIEETISCVHWTTTALNYH